MFQLGHHEPLRLWLALLLAVAAAIAVRGQQPELGTWEVAPDGQAAAWRGTLLPVRAGRRGLSSPPAPASARFLRAHSLRPTPPRLRPSGLRCFLAGQ